ncbi:MAG: ABC transporter ATP-binding protein, partial [Candidatus Methylomirabilales bacterium]
LKGVDFTLKEGEALALIGPNGSGKTTLFNLISGLLSPTSGSIRFQGEEIAGKSPHQICRLGIGRTFQLTSPFLEMSLLENVLVGILFGRKVRLPLKEAEGEALELLQLVGMEGKAERPAKALSLGQMKRLELGMALSTKPKLLLLDEPLAGLDPAASQEIIALLKRINREGISLFFIEHSLEAVLELTDRVMALHQGEVIAEGRPEAVIRDPHVVEAYLGE